MVNSSPPWVQPNGNEVSRYLHLNPVRTQAARRLEVGERRRLLRDYAWSSFAACAGLRSCPSWLNRGETLLSLGGDKPAGMKAYRAFVEVGLMKGIAVFLSSDNHWALSGGRDNTFRLLEVSTGGCVRTFGGHMDRVDSVCLSSDGHWVLSGSSDKTLRLWELDWDYEFPGWADWDEGARPHLVTFLTLHTPYAAALPKERQPSPDEIAAALTRRGKPTWTEDGFKGLLYTLGCAGFGWLRPEGVRGELEKMATDWQGPPPLF